MKRSAFRHGPNQRRREALGAPQEPFCGGGGVLRYQTREEAVRAPPVAAEGRFACW